MRQHVGSTLGSSTCSLTTCPKCKRICPDSVFFLSSKSFLAPWSNGEKAALNLQKDHAGYEPINLKRR